MVIVAAAVVAVAGGIAGLVLAVMPGTFTATGTVTLMDSTSLSTYSSYSSPRPISFSGDSCRGTGGYSDLGLGTGVTIRDPDGTIVGAGEITGSAALEPMCELSFTVSDVPSGEGPYTVEVSHRGEVTVTEQELAGGGAALTIGG